MRVSFKGIKFSGKISNYSWLGFNLNTETLFGVWWMVICIHQHSHSIENMFHMVFSTLLRLIASMLFGVPVTSFEFICIEVGNVQVKWLTRWFYEMLKNGIWQLIQNRTNLTFAFDWDFNWYINANFKLSPTPQNRFFAIE